MKRHIIFLMLAVLTITIIGCGDGGSSSTTSEVEDTLDRHKAWGVPVIIDAGDYAIYKPHVAFDKSGNALAIWEQSDDDTNSVYSIYTNRYDAQTGLWEEAELIEASAFNAYNPQIAFDADGNALAIWEQSDDDTNSVYSIYTNRYDAQTGLWEGAELIETSIYNTHNPQVAFDADGNALAIWEQLSDWPSTFYNILANRYDAQTGLWEGAKHISLSHNEKRPRLAFDANGNAIVVWREADDLTNNAATIYSIYVNHYDAQTGLWRGALAIEVAAPSALGPELAVDPNGDALVVWYQGDGTYRSIFANRYDSQMDIWGVAEHIDAGHFYAYNPHVAFDKSGNAIAVWRQDDDNTSAVISIYAARFNAKTGLWEEAELIEESAYKAYSAQVALDAEGNAFAIWTQDNGMYENVYTNRYDVEIGAWEGEVLIENNSDHAFVPDIAFDEEGNAISVWYHSGSQYTNVYVNHYK